MKKKEVENPEFAGVLEGLIETAEPAEKEKKLNLHAGHRHRVKQRFVEEGLKNFHDHQVLELLLFYAQPYKDVNELAHLLLLRFGSLSGVFEASVNDLMEVKGVGYNTAVLLSLVPGIVNRYQMDKWRDKESLDTSSKMGKYVLSLFAGKVNETICIVALDSHNKVNGTYTIAEGVINEVSFPPRMIVEAVIHAQAKNIIVAHNHPGGVLKPSKMDIEMTKKLIIILRAISVKVLDHVIVGHGHYLSFEESGVMALCRKSLGIPEPGQQGEINQEG